MNRSVSISTLMFVILVFGIELMLLRIASEQSARALVNLTALALLASAFLARYRRGYAGAWWFGVALFGWGYLGMVAVFGDHFELGKPLIAGLEPLMGRIWPQAVDVGVMGGPRSTSIWNDVTASVVAVVVQLVAVCGGVVGPGTHHFLALIESRGVNANTSAEPNALEGQAPTRALSPDPDRHETRESRRIGPPEQTR